MINSLDIRAISRALVTCPSSSSPLQFLNVVLSIPSSPARSFIRFTNSSSFPHMYSAIATQASLALATEMHLQNSRKRPLLLEQLICLYEHRDPACKVTMEQLFKANGMVLAENGTSVKIRAIQSEHEDDGMAEETDIQKACNEFKSLIFSMKGQRNMKQFAKDCGISVSSLSRITTGNRKTYLPQEFLETMFVHKSPDSKVTMAELIETNTKFPGAKGDTFCFKGTNKKGIDEKMVLETLQKESAAIISYDEYLEDLASYLYGMDAAKIKAVRKKCQDYFENKVIVELLHTYHQLSKKEWDLKIDVIRKFYLDKAPLNLPEKLSGIVRGRLEQLI